MYINSANRCVSADITIIAPKYRVSIILTLYKIRKSLVFNV